VVGLAHIHHNNFIHRDLKPDNIFIVDEIGMLSRFAESVVFLVTVSVFHLAKIGDFGLAVSDVSAPSPKSLAAKFHIKKGEPLDRRAIIDQHIEEKKKLEEEEKREEFGKEDGEKRAGLRMSMKTTGLGTFIYSAPEQLSGTGVRRTIDI